MTQQGQLRRHLLEAMTITVIAVLCAFVSNLLAARERKVAIITAQRAAIRPSPAPAVKAVPLNSTEMTASAEPNSAARLAPAPPLPAAAPAEVSAPMPDAPQPQLPPKPGPPVSPTAKPSAAPPPGTATTAAVNPPPTPVAAEPLTKRFPPHPEKAYGEITGEDVQLLHARGALFLDARRTSVYEEGHIAGARSFSVWEADVDNKVAALTEEFRDQNQPVVIYCSGGACEDSHLLAQKLWGMFFTNALVYKDGFPDWQARGGKVNRGSKP